MTLRTIKKCLPEEFPQNPYYPGPPCMLQEEGVDRSDEWTVPNILPEMCLACNRWEREPDDRPSWWWRWLVRDSRGFKELKP